MLILSNMINSTKIFFFNFLGETPIKAGNQINEPDVLPGRKKYNPIPERTPEPLKNSMVEKSSIAYNRTPDKQKCNFFCIFFQLYLVFLKEFY